MKVTEQDLRAIEDLRLSLRGLGRGGTTFIYSYLEELERRVKVSLKQGEAWNGNDFQKCNGCKIYKPKRDIDLTSLGMAIIKEEIHSRYAGFAYLSEIGQKNVIEEKIHRAIEHLEAFKEDGFLKEPMDVIIFDKYDLRNGDIRTFVKLFFGKHYCVYT